MFDLFWKLYPRKVAKLAASKAWAKLTPAECEKALAVLADHIASWSDRDMDKVPHAATWINGKRFDDELDAPKIQRVMSDHEFFRIHGYSRQSREEAS